MAGSLFVWAPARYLPGSTSRCNTVLLEQQYLLVEGLGRCLPTKHLARPRVQRVRDRFDLLGRPPRQVGALREVLAQKPVRVLVRAALPGRLRIGKEHRDARLDAELRMRRHLLAAIPC